MSQTQFVGDPEREFVVALLALYKDNPLLWNPTNDQYTNKYRRHVALNNMCSALREHKPDYTIDDLKKKLNILRTNFNKERNKINRKKSTLDEEAEPNLWYYNEMTFLIGHEMPAKVSKVNTSPSNRKLIKPIKRKKISIFSDQANIKRPETEEDILAKCWTMKLRKLAPDQRLYAEKIINDTLFEAKMGSLTRYGVAFNTEPADFVQYSSESDAESTAYNNSEIQQD